MNIFPFSTYWQFLRDRRRYQQNFSPYFCKKIVYAESLQSNHHNLSNLRYPSEPSSESLQKNLTVCSKSGTWRYLKTLGICLWTSRYVNYFPAYKLKLQNSNEPNGGIANNIKSLKILEMQNVFYLSDYLKSNGLNMFTFKIRRFLRYHSSVIKLDLALTLEIGGADSFQHFIQDCLPLLSHLKVKGIISSEIPVILKEPLPNHQNIILILRKYFPEINFLFVRSGEVYFVSRLLIPHFKPRNYIWSLPQVMLQSTKTLVSNQEIGKETSKSLIFLERGRNKMRNLQKSEEVKKKLALLAHELSLEFHWIDTSKIGLFEIAQKVAHGRIVLGIHGGSMYNLLFAQDKSLIVELIPTRDTNTVLNFAVGLDHLYLPIPLDFKFADEEVTISQHELECIVQEIRSNFSEFHREEVYE
jgi:capsular polysaccharide biosynthesis protein